MNDNPKAVDAEAHSRVQAIMLSVARRRIAGVDLPDAAVLAEHPDLTELLTSQLDKLRVIQAAGLQAALPASETETAWHSPTRHTPEHLRIRCPHCREQFEMPSDTPVAEIICTSCGSQFSLAGSTLETHAAAAFQELAHFNLVEQIGMGGFGTVWKGHDKELDRTVAIKLPRQGSMTDQELDKFLREARAAAQLKHPNIVTVHEVGRDGTLVFIVSDYVRGISLDEWQRGQQPTMSQAAELCLTIAEALHHAHEHGVIHRDLKPANILVDGDGRPHITDFGLARREAGEVTMTMDGQVLGTPAYMSPEQAQGEAHTADRRSDVYSLGVILFQLLTGELPFRGNARMLMQQVIHDEPPSPRKFNSNVPKDLETITLKCMEKEPLSRYQTAQEVADDLRRFISGQSVHARPIGRIGRAWRWCKRSPAIASLTGAVTTLMIVAMAILAVSNVRIARERTEAKFQRDRADTNYRRSREVVDRVLERAAYELEAIPGSAEVRQTVLKDALEFYDNFTADLAGDPQSRYDAAMAYRKIGDIAHSLGDLDRRELASEKSDELLNDLVRQFPDSELYKRDLARNRNGYERGQEVWISLEQTCERDQVRVQRSEQLVNRYPNTLYYFDRLAGDSTRLGISLGGLGRNGDALHYLRRSVKMRQDRAAKFPDAPHDQGGLAYSHHWLGWKLLFMNQLEESGEHLHEAVRLITELKTSEPENLHIASEYATYIVNLARWNNAEGNLNVAEAQYRDAIKVREKCVTNLQSAAGQSLLNDDKIADQYASLERAHAELLGILSLKSAVDQLKPIHQGRIECAERLVQLRPDILDFRRRLASSYGDYMFYIGHHSGATTHGDEIAQLNKKAAINRKAADASYHDSIDRSEQMLRRLNDRSATPPLKELVTVYRNLESDYYALIELLEDDTARAVDLDAIHKGRMKYAKLLTQTMPSDLEYRSGLARSYTHYALYRSYNPDIYQHDDQEVLYAKKATEINPTSRDAWLQLEVVHRRRGDADAANAILAEIESRFAQKKE